MRRGQKIMGRVGAVCLLSLLLSFVLTPLEAQGKRKPRVPTSKKDIVMLTDQEIKYALKEDAAIVLVKTEATEVVAPGTRGHQTFYKLNIIQSLIGKLTGTVDATRYGAPVLQKEQTAIVVLLISPHDEHRLQACALVPDGKQAEAVKTHVARIEKLKAAK